MTILNPGSAFSGVSQLTLFLTVALLFPGQTRNASAQQNSWTKPSSGNWEEPSWSLGVLPGSGQSILIANAGWKAVMISQSTVQNYPQTLNVDSIAIASPTDSFNTLLVNYAGFQNPLTVKSLSIGSNSAMTMLASTLVLNGPTGVGMAVGGTFNQNDFSLVTGNQLDIGYNGPGTYNLNSGLINVGNVWVGGSFHGVFNQYGGSNGVGILHLDGGVYNFIDGDFGPEVYFNGGTLRQQGGRIDHALTMYRGAYILENGVNNGGTVVPIAISGASSQVIQTGGTNFGPIQLGYYGYGTYTLSNGVALPPALTVNYYGYFDQLGGSVTTTGQVRLIGGWVNRGDRALGFYDLDDGYLSSSGLYLDTGSFAQKGGTNRIDGDINMILTTHNYYYLYGGLLTDNNTTIQDSWVGGFFQSGGVHVITNQLSIYTSQLPFWYGYVMSGGQLTVSNIVVNPFAVFNQTGGTLNQSGLLTLISGNVFGGPGSQQFGSLQLSGDSVNSNSTLSLPTNACVLRFRDSHTLTWVVGARLTIKSWSGSSSGGGNQQIIFGDSAGALTSQQLSQIEFVNPGGLPSGTYTSQILSTGEIVPELLSPTGPGPALVRIQRQLDHSMTVSLQGIPGRNYGIDTSKNLVNWIRWTNRTATNGVISITDTTGNASRRFYRAVLLP